MLAVAHEDQPAVASERGCEQPNHLVERNAAVYHRSLVHEGAHARVHHRAPSVLVSPPPMESESLLSFPSIVDDFTVLINSPACFRLPSASTACLSPMSCPVSCGGGSFPLWTCLSDFLALALVCRCMYMFYIFFRLLISQALGRARAEGPGRSATGVRSPLMAYCILVRGQLAVGRALGCGWCDARTR